MVKRRILHVGEASFLNTGYAKYSREVNKRLKDYDGFEIAEHAVYGHPNDHRGNNSPWIYLGAGPDNENAPEFQYPIDNKFGRWRYEENLLRFKPHFVWDIRDIWMMMFEITSPYRRLYNLAMMPAIDGTPQDEQWISMYCEADAIFGYTDWAIRELNRQSNNRIKTKEFASPGVDLNVFKPVPNRTQFKTQAFNKETFIIGTIMRNQKRKLFPDLIKSFDMYLDKCLENGQTNLYNKTYLYLHTSYPDVGWDIPKLIKESKVGHKILFTYLCKACHTAFPSIFQDARTICPRCNQFAAMMTSPRDFVPEETLAGIINLFDVYVQYASLEACGMGQIEAAGCGVPVMATDYSGMSDIVAKLRGGGIPIKVERYYREAETHRNFALPDNNDFVQKLIQFFNLPEPIRNKKGFEARKMAEKYYNWDNIAKTWADYFMSIDPEDRWNQPVDIHVIDRNIRDLPSNEDFLNEAISKILGGRHKIQNYQYTRMLRALNWGGDLPMTGGVYINELSVFNLISPVKEYTRQNAIDELVMISDEWNTKEAARAKVMGL